MRESTTFREIVNVDNNEITVLDEVFKYDDKMKGATGFVLVPISREEYEDKVNDVDAIAEYLYDATSELPDECKMTGYTGWAQAIVDNCEGENVFWDLSYNEVWDYIRDELKLSEDDAYVFDCISCGRIFNENYQGNYNTELSAVIREYETK